MVIFSVSAGFGRRSWMLSAMIVTIHLTSAWMVYGCQRAPVKCARALKSDLVDDPFGSCATDLECPRDVRLSPRKMRRRPLLSRTTCVALCARWDGRQGEVRGTDLG